MIGPTPYMYIVQCTSRYFLTGKRKHQPRILQHYNTLKSPTISIRNCKSYWLSNDKSYDLNNTICMTSHLISITHHSSLMSPLLLHDHHAFQYYLQLFLFYLTNQHFLRLHRPIALWNRHRHRHLKN
jgi:hypothetical protein